MKRCDIREDVFENEKDCPYYCPNGNCDCAIQYGTPKPRGFHCIAEEERETSLTQIYKYLTSFICKKRRHLKKTFLCLKYRGEMLKRADGKVGYIFSSTENKFFRYFPIYKVRKTYLGIKTIGW
jgi:hypothetical protein